MNPMMLVMAMSVGQGPATGIPAAPAAQYPVIRSQAVGAPPAVLPNTLPTVQAPGVPVRVAQQPMPMDMTTPAPAIETPREEVAADEAPEAPVYLLERSLRETWLGKKMADHNLRLYGWTAMNYSVSTNSVTNLPMTFNDQPNRFQMNQNWLHFEKAIDTTKAERQWGFVTDSILPGTDARFTIIRGLFDQQLPTQYPFDLYQAYVQAFFPNLGPKGTSVKVGRFSTHCGYEVVQAVDTPFVSKSYLFQYNPFTHTGALATTQITDNFSVSNGIATGSDTFIDPANRFTYLGQLKWANPEGKNTFLFNTVITNPQFDAAEAFAFYNVYNVQWIHKFTDKLTYALDASYSHMYDVPGVGNSDWYGAANYFIYKFTDCLTGTIRAELFNDSQGVRTGFAGLYTEVTAGVAWSPKPGLIIRPSVRYDNNASNPAFEGKNDMWSAAFELIFRW